jgi:hypothetical protein
LKDWKTILLVGTNYAIIMLISLANPYVDVEFEEIPGETNL